MSDEIASYSEAFGQYIFAYRNGIHAPSREAFPSHIKAANWRLTEEETHFDDLSYIRHKEDGKTVGKWRGSQRYHDDRKALLYFTLEDSLRRALGFLREAAEYDITSYTAFHRWLFPDEQQDCFYPHDYDFSLSVHHADRHTLRLRGVPRTREKRWFDDPIKFPLNAKTLHGDLVSAIGHP